MGPQRANGYNPSCRAICLLQSNNSFFLAAAFVVAPVCYSFFLLLGPFPLQDPDTFWHIRIGQWILDHAEFPSVDFYSYTEFGKPWSDAQWLAEVFYALAYKFGGWRGVAILAAATIAAVIGALCFYLLRRLRFSVAIGLAALTAGAITPHFLARPHLFSYLLLAIWMIALLDAYDDDKFDLPPLLILAPIMILWANIHGSFTLALLLLYIFAGCCLRQNFVRRNYSKCRHLLVIVVAVSACAAITPYLLSPAFLTTKLLGMKFAQHYIVEWRSPDFQGRILRLGYFVAIFAAIAGLGIRLRGPRLIAFGLFVILGLSYIRGLMMFFFVVPMILARPAAAAAGFLVPQVAGAKTAANDRGFDPVLQFLRKRSFAFIAGGIACAALITASDWWRQDIVPPKWIMPSAAVDFAREANISGNVFNWYGFGGYLIFSGIPTFIDGRAELFGEAFANKYFETETLVDINQAFATLDEYKVRWVVFPPQEPLAQALGRNASWDRVYSDQYSVVYVRHR
jgi:hypothetical protein